MSQNTNKLPSSNTIPAVLTNAKVYKDNSNLVGIANIDLPSFEYMTESISGLGIAGEVESPIRGHFKAMSLKLKWNTTTESGLGFLDLTAHQLDIRANVQEYDAGTGEYLDTPVKILVQGSPKSSGLGKLEPGKKMDSETDFEISYIKIWQNGNELLELDKFNFIFKIKGQDQLLKVRQNLGME